MSNETKHARLSPSAAHRWMRCPASLGLEEKLPRVSSKYADEGTAAHEVAAMCLERGEKAVAYIGHTTEQEVGCDAEMAASVQVYIDNVLEFAKGNQLLVEQRLDFSSCVGVDDSFGTSDAVIITLDEIQVHDLKYGKGVKVDAEDNEQLMLYALGALNSFGMIGDFKTVRCVIHQPRLGHLSEWSCTVSDLLAFGQAAKAQGRSAISLAENPSDHIGFDPSEKACQFCRAKATCPALAEQVHQSITSDFNDLEEALAEDHTQSAPDGLSTKMGYIDLIEMWCKAVRSEVHRRLSAGEPVSGYKLVQGRKGNRQWSDEEAAEKYLKAARFKMEDMYDMTLMSPTKLEKLMADKHPTRWNKLKELITRKDGAPAIAPASDKRPALDVCSVASCFEAIED